MCAGMREQWDCSVIRSRNRACSDRCCWRGWGGGDRGQEAVVRVGNHLAKKLGNGRSPEKAAGGLL